MRKSIHNFGILLTIFSISEFMDNLVSGFSQSVITLERGYIISHPYDCTKKKQSDVLQWKVKLR